MHISYEIMSPASLGGGNKLFTREIQQDLVKLLLQDLETLRKKLFSKRVEGVMQSTNTAIQREMYKMQRISTNIQRKVKVMTEFLTAINEWENQVLNCFLKIKRFFQKYQNEDEFLSRIDQNNHYLQEVLDDIIKLKDRVPKIDKAQSNEPSQDTTFEIGGSSNSSVNDTGTKKDDGFVNSVVDTNSVVLHSLAIFPENAELKKKLLINWWVGLGILPFEGDASAMENQSTKIFSQLEENYILKPKQIKKHNRATDSYTINFTILQHLISDLKRKRRIVFEDKEDPLHFYKDDKDDVIAVLNLNQKHLTNSKYISEPAIKVALLGKWHYTDIDVHDKNKINKETIYYAGGTKFFQKMGETMTYLSLRGISKIEELPQSVGRIRCLKILDLRDCHSLQKLPEKPKSLIDAALCNDNPWFKELMHLDITGCYLLSYMPKWVCELSNLQVLKGAMFNCFLIITDQCQLKDLSKLQKLVKLSIKIIHPEFLSREDCIGLESLDSLLVLTIVWNFHERETKKQSKDNIKDSTNIFREGDDQIPGVIRKNARGKASSSRFRGKRKEVNNDKTVEKKQQSTNNSGVNEDGRKIPTIFFPKNLKKLDIRCYPYAEAPELSNAAKLTNLKRLYIRGGKLANIKKDADWQVEILRLRFLKFLDLDWYDLCDIFPKLQCVEYEKCLRLKSVTHDSGYWCKEINGALFKHAGPFDDDEPVPIKYPTTIERVVPSIETLSHDLYNMEALLKLSREVDPSKDALDLVMVLDIRRSMAHQELAIMKTAVLSFIKDLISFPFIRLSIVTFGTHAKRQCELLLLTENCRTKLEKLVGGFEADGTTTVSDGLEMGLKVLKNRGFGREHPTGMMLISGSDHIGNALHVPMDDVTVHTFGISSSQDYDRTALEYIAAKSRKGTFTDVSNIDDLVEALHKCRRLLYSVQDLTLAIIPEKNITISSQSEDGTDHGSLIVSFGDVFPEEVRTATIKLKRSDGHALEGSLTEAFTVKYSYRFGEATYEGAWKVSNDWPNLRLSRVPPYDSRVMDYIRRKQGYLSRSLRS